MLISSKSILEITQKTVNQLPIRSKVLTMNEDSLYEHFQFIDTSLCRPSKYKLIFRASQHDFSAKAFHEHCDKINDTLILARTEFGKTIAGYSHYKWGVEEDRDVKVIKDDYGYINDVNRQAFLLLVEKR